MMQEHKDLLLKDLSARLPYGVKGRVSRHDHNNRECEFVATIDGKLYDKFAVAQESWYDNVTIKPCLFPLSSMTEEQKQEYNGWKHMVPVCHYEYGDVVEEFELFDSPASFEYLIENHFDYYDLIPMGLAEDATGKNIY